MRHQKFERHYHSKNEREKDDNLVEKVKFEKVTREAPQCWELVWLFTGN